MSAVTFNFHFCRYLPIIKISHSFPRLIFLHHKTVLYYIIKLNKNNMLKFGVKSAILGTAVYYTVEKGVWKDSATTSELYNELEKGVSPYVGELKKQMPYELPPLPSNDQLSYLCKYYWNSGVKATFRFLIDLPDHATNAVNKTYNSLSTALEPSEPSLKSNDGKK